MIGFYFQDDWRISNRVLLNIGIRYNKDIDTYGIAKQANSRTRQELIAAAATPIATVPTAALANTVLDTRPTSVSLAATTPACPILTTRNISPRMGFSFEAPSNSKLVLRGGYGLYFDQTFENIPLFMLQRSHIAMASIPLRSFVRRQQTLLQAR